MTKTSRSYKEILEELEKAFLLQEVIQENAAYALIATNKEGVITSFNPAAEKLLGYEAHEIVDKTSPAIFHDLEEVVQRTEEFNKKLGTSFEPGFETFVCHTDRDLANEFEWTYIHKNGRKFPVSLSITALKDKTGEVLGYLGIANDISVKKEEEAFLRAAKENAENTLKIKNQFFANMSHEIRTPMNGIIGMTELLMGEIKDTNALDKLDIIKESANSLLNILNDILDFSKFEENKVTIEKNPFNLIDLLERTLSLYQASIKERQGLSLSYSIAKNVPQFIISDQFRIKQVLNNLLNNAIKFTEKGLVEVEVSAHKMEGNNFQISFEVKDQGIGITDKQKKIIFENFTQADETTTRRFGGTGLGLSIVKNLVELLGGEIEVRDNTDGGSIFHFSLITQVAKEQATNIDLENPNLYLKSDLKILLVEDVQINQKVALGFLKKLGLDADIANNGQEAYEKVCQNTYDIVFMDCHMPILDGFEATNLIKSKLKEKSPFIIALTASTLEQDIKHCYSSGMDYFLSKPLRKIDLKKSLEEFFNFKQTG